MIETRDQAKPAVPGGGRAALVLIVFFIVNLLFLVSFADRDGYEGDDLNSILPMAHLTAAKHGLLLIYRYAWQPLSYEVGARLWQLFGTPTAVFLSAPVSGAIALTGLFALAWAEAPRRHGAWIALVALLGVPEFWFSALYYNSTIVGLPFAVGAILLLRWRDGLGAAALAGAAMGIAVLMRLDFILACPLLAMVAWSRARRVVRPIILAGAVMATLAIGMAIGLIDLPAIVAIQAQTAAEIHAKANSAGWNALFRLRVASIALSPIGWLLLVGGAPLLVARAVRARRWSLLLWPIAALPACYPVLSILSPKYILPLALFLPLLFVHAAGALLDGLAPLRRTRGVQMLGAVALVPVLVSVSLSGYPPFAAPGLFPARPVPTHDGPRGYGGYLWLAIATDGPAAQSPAQIEALRLRDRLRTEPSLIVAGSENFFDSGGIAWRHLQLRLEREGAHGTLVAPHELRFTSAAHTLLMVDTPPATLPPGTRLIDLTGSANRAVLPQQM